MRRSITTATKNEQKSQLFALPISSRARHAATTAWCRLLCPIAKASDEPHLHCRLAWVRLLPRLLPLKQSINQSIKCEFTPQLVCPALPPLLCWSTIRFKLIVAFPCKMHRESFKPTTAKCSKSPACAGGPGRIVSTISRYSSGAVLEERGG